MNRREFLFAGSAAVLASACGSISSPSAPTSSSAPPPPVSAVANPVNLTLAGQFYTSLEAKQNGTLQDALSDNRLSSSSSEVSYRNPDGSSGRYFLIHTINGNRPSNGFDFMINGGHYFAPAYNFPVRAGDKIDIYMPPAWDGHSA